MHAILTAPMLTIASQAGAERGNLCDIGWWGTATEADVQSEFDAGADVMARDEDGWTPLHRAAAFKGTSLSIQALLAAGANVNALDENGFTALHIVRSSRKWKVSSLGN